jgi:hypothetical protein
MKRHNGQKLILPFPVVETAEIIGAQTAIEALEGIRDRTVAEEWVNPLAKHYVLFGIKLCIQVLRKQDINEIT